MSRIGKQPILIPQGVEVEIKEGEIRVKGPKGELFLEYDEKIKIERENNHLKVMPKEESVRSKNVKALWGLYRSLINNMIIGVTQGYEKKLELKGIGYKASVDGQGNLVLEVGYSHPVIIQKEEGIDFAVEKNIVSVKGIDKQKVGEMAARIRKVRPPEPYKGSGIRYLGEKIKIKLGKKAAGATQ